MSWKETLGKAVAMLRAAAKATVEALARKVGAVDAADAQWMPAGTPRS
jgi:hypothetical protein